MDRRELLAVAGIIGVSAFASNRGLGDPSQEPMTFTYKTTGSCKIKLDAFSSDPNVKKAVIVFIHGGCLISGSRKGGMTWLDHPAGYVLVSIDYRLAPETKLPAIIEDVQGAFLWIHRNGPQILNIDPEELVVVGESAGGYQTLMTGFCIKSRPRALISLSGYGDIKGPWYSTPSAYYLRRPRVSKAAAFTALGTTCVTEGGNLRYKVYDYCRQNGIWAQEVTGHNPHTESKWFDRYCPLRNVTSNYPPTVLIHGTADTDVPYDEAVAMDKALTRFHVPHKFISVPGGGHGLSGVAPDKRARVYKEALAFAEEHVG